MKLKTLMTLCFAGAATLGAYAQTHVEGQEYYKADQLSNAKDLLNRALGNAGTDKAVANYYLGMIALEHKEDAAATKYFAEGIAANPEYAYNYIGQGEMQLKAGDDKAAEASFKLARKYGSKDASVEIAIARAYDAVDPVKYEKQIAKCVEKARKRNMQNPDLYIFEGDQARERKDIGSAAAKYEMAKNYDKNATAAYVKYANLFTQVNPDYAVKMLQELLSVNPNSALGQRELANAYYNKKDYANAVKQYAAYVNNPSHFDSDENRYAFLLFYGGDFKKGYDFATKRLASDPNDFTALRYQFMNAAQLPEMKDRTLALAENLYNVHKANPSANKMAPIDYTLIADEMGKAKRADEAIEVLKDGIKTNPDNSNLDKQLAMAYVDKNDLAAASEAYKGYLAKVEEPSYNDYIQLATFLYYAGVQYKEDPAKADTYFAEEEEVLNKAAEAYPGFYKPNKMRGDIAKAKAAEIANADDMTIASAAVPMYTKAIAEYESIEPANRSKAAQRDAADMFLYMGNYYVKTGDNAKGKDMFFKYLEIRPEDNTVREYANKL